ncbi:MAG: ACP S-malonyltransferase [Sphingorhabdus sp.]
MKEKLLVICPGRGTYNATELGYLKRHHAARGDLVAQLDAYRAAQGQLTISALDNAEKFSPSLHMSGDNASLLIYACAMADFAAIDRDRFDIVAVTGNSMGWYLALACAGILDFDAGARLVNNMGRLMHEKGQGGQVIWSMANADWRIDRAKAAEVEAILGEAATRDDIAVHVSIRLGAMIVFAADDAGVAWLMARLPKDDRFPMKLNQHAAFHSPLLRAITPEAKELNPPSAFGVGAIPAVDGTGFIWSPKAFHAGSIHDYTLYTQICATYDFTRAVQVAAREFCPDRIAVLGPGTTLGAPVAQALIDCGWRGLSGKADFLARQSDNPVLISMGMADQRAYVTAN